MDDVNFAVLGWVTLGIFLGPTIIAFTWAAAHHWDLPDELEHPV
jgi:hypothetical protein